jgi:histidinol-phosphate/aromatic aminotransferase/cobyric acid decarboxylase-like protein
LDRNANAYGPSERAIAAMREAVNSVRYPDVETERLRGKIASVHRVKPEQVILGAGSGEILRMAVDAFAGPGKRLVVATPTFEPVGRYARRRVRKHGILIGPVFPDFERYVRVSMGTAEQMNEFWRVWDLMPRHHTM